jgi:hypothetical protein
LIKYPVIAVPPELLGAVQVSVTDPGEATAETAVGRSGEVIGVAVTAAEEVVAFSLVFEVTVTEYAVPPVSPVKTVE